LLADSLTLDWHSIFNAAPKQAEQMPRVRKDWTANPTLDWHTIFNATPLLVCSAICSAKFSFFYQAEHMNG
jgi:hypothetical protein